MNVITCILLFIVMVGYHFCTAHSTSDKEADITVGSTGCGCLFNLLGTFLGFMTILGAAVFFSIKVHWWIFLLFIPAYFIAGYLTTFLISKLPFGKEYYSEEKNLPLILLKKSIGAFLVILAYVLFFILYYFADIDLI